MTIVQRLKALIVLFMAILLAIGLAEYVQLNKTLSVVKQFINTNEPIERSLLEIEINANESYREIIGYLRNQNPSHLHDYNDQIDDLARYINRFVELIDHKNNDSHIQSLERVTRQLQSLGMEVVQEINKRNHTLSRMRQHIASLKRFVRNRKKTNNDIFPETLPIDSIVEYILSVDTFADMQVLPTPGIDKLGNHLQKSGRRVLDVLRRLQTTTFTKSDQEAITQLAEQLVMMTPHISHLTSINRQIANDIDRIEALTAELDRLLDENIQPRILQESRKTLTDASNRAGESIVFHVVSIVISILLVAWIGYTLGSRMAQSIRQLILGAKEVGRGNLSARIKISGNDELATLAQTFNQMAASLKENKDKFRVIYENLQDIYLEKSFDGVILEINPAAEDILGYSPDNLTGKDITILYTHKETHDALLRKLNESGRFTDMEVELQAIDGRQLIGSISAQICYDNESRSRKICSMIRDISARKEAEDNLNILLAENRKLTKQVFSSIEAERRRLASDLHDEMGQAITAIMLAADMIQKKTEENCSAVFSHAGEIRNIARELILSMRHFVNNLRPPLLDSFGLVDTMRHTLSRWALQHESIRCAFECHEQIKNLPDNVEIYLYRVFQESLTNISKHSEATQVTINLFSFHHGHTEAICLEIKDNGIGLPPETLQRGTGIAGMRERVVSLGGSFSITSEAPGWNTVVKVEIPLVEIQLES